MATLELTTEQVIALVKQLSFESKQLVFSVLHADLQGFENRLDTETQEWLEANLDEELPPYDWGIAGVPFGKPIRYSPGQGFVIEGGKTIV
ncbi:MAG: hypothetical protein HC866_09845 [Leptolyngbyaceae cyanobacterium RU_5_1]|nr:hypothetical protein [Leptolyngbyaceae cyanobacterium RU_5_1]